MRVHRDVDRIEQLVSLLKENLRMNYSDNIKW